MSPARPSTATYAVAIVGAGFAGVTMAKRLKDAGIQDFVILEEAEGAGGVWRDNVYPGCTCDVPSHLYSFGFAQFRDTRVRYPSQAAILDYLRRVVDENGLGRHLCTHAAVSAATFDDATARWTLTTASGPVYANAVVWAVGQLHRPRVPEFAGVETFGGRAFHSADREQWSIPDGLDGDIAVVGTGSSATQMLPELARTALSVTVYQRSAAWVLPKPSTRFGPVAQWLLERVPGAHRAHRAALAFVGDAVLAPIMRGGWSARPAEWVARRHLRRQVPDRALRRKLLPPYAIGEKRVLLDSKFYPALTLPNVRLVTDTIDRLTPEGIRTVDGSERRADAIVWATGFQAQEFFGGITVTGRGGADLHRVWSESGGPQAFWGMAVPRFPNMYMIAGPHSFTPANSNPLMKDIQARYILRCLRLSARRDAPIEVTEAAMSDYRAWLATSMAGTVWPTGAASWFKSAERVTNPWPGTVREFERRLAHNPVDVFVTPILDTDTRERKTA
ncbi:NAD(P)/FAD-dependent oxidoreductase [Nocardia sp. NPDC050712]|uniref:flavin-containing monooxygenase n=1 Tax=Nocardia sp. NPDC050712 TaxID=3155518 RepID=UPI0033C79E4B